MIGLLMVVGMMVGVVRTMRPGGAGERCREGRDYDGSFHEQASWAEGLIFNDESPGAVLASMHSGQ